MIATKNFKESFNKMEFTVESLTNKLKDKFDQIFQLIEKYDTICLFTHDQPDPDALGSQNGLAAFLKNLYPNKRILRVGQSHPLYSRPNEDFYPEVDEVSDEDLAKSPYLAIITDVRVPDRIPDKRFYNAGDVVAIDHHPVNTNIGNPFIMEPEVAAACEIVADLCFYKDEKAVTEEVAEYLYSGIIGDTLRFKRASTNIHTFEVAYRLIKAGASPSKIGDILDRKNIKLIKLKKYVLKHLHLTENGLGYYILSQRELRRIGIPQSLAKEALHELENCVGIDAWMSISEHENGVWRVSLRSNFINVQPVVVKFGGGGHETECGAKISKKEIRPLIRECDRHLREEKEKACSKE